MGCGGLASAGELRPGDLPVNLPVSLEPATFEPVTFE